MVGEEIFLGRQPILDRDQRVVAYELLFRAGRTREAGVTDDMQATASVIRHAFSEMGVQAVLGQHTGFINVSADMLLSDLIEVLPRAQVVLELLETVDVTEAVVERCRLLKQRGFRLALDDFAYDERYRPLLDLVDIVKVDLPLHTPHALRALVARLRNWPVQLLAEKVDSAEQAHMCRELGFDLFQGYYFARPAVLSARRANPAHLAIIRLLDLVLADAETGEIEDVFKQYPNLTYNLLRLVNSAGCAGARRIGTVSQAILLLGRKQLQRWLQLLLFTLQEDTPYPSPLLLMAASRGRVMELLAVRKGARADLCESAFMTGILSLIENVIGKPLPDIVQELNLGEQLAAALLRREGELGILLDLAESLEHPDPRRTLDALQAAAGLTLLDTAQAEIEAMAWTHQLVDNTYTN
ncbi:EAL domain-containing protein [Betaproteobacteria bacterium SCN1]|nr:EAL domain-containing protein [Betaproteobacteria bacterium SCN1]MBN8760760.1 EAL domain-containing protein [Thiobacillus sp.]ODU91311.1 MAG: diguanylate phosphodiesterase [Thiobacillus sp. SCN 65-179]OJW36127.1 MAG: EAL domain-containing protein [Thiobacillus sp. 65-69]